MHNHPSGDPKPSRDDIEMTRKIKTAAEALGISIHDHLVIGRKRPCELQEPGAAVINRGCDMEECLSGASIFVDHVPGDSTCLFALESGGDDDGLPLLEFKIVELRKPGRRGGTGL